MIISARMSILFLLLLAITSAAGQGLFEQSLDSAESENDNLYTLHGFVRSAIYTGYTSDENKFFMQSLYSHFGLIAEVRTGKFGKGYAEFRYRGGYEFGEKFAIPELREAYTDTYLGPLNIRAGKQILSWGASSFLNPSDQFSPQDNTFRSPVKDDLRMGNWALRTSLMVSGTSSFDFIWLPIYQPSVLMVQPFRFPDYIELQDYKTESSLLNESGFGFKYDLRSRLLDLQLSYFNGYRNTPSLKTDSVAIDFTTLEPELVSLKQQPYRIHSAGVNITIPVSSYLLRTEVGWMQPVEGVAQPELPFPEISWAVEVEQSGTNVTLVGGYYGKYILDFKENATEAVLITSGPVNLSEMLPPGTTPTPELFDEAISNQMSGFNRLYNYQENEFYHAVYAAASISLFREQAELEVPGMYNFTSGELTLMPSLKINITDGMSIRMGMYFLSGREHSLYDLIASELNAVYTLVEIKF
ncbi:MAG: DUF1302 family protein [Bacteroidales bacterium]